MCAGAILNVPLCMCAHVVCQTEITGNYCSSLSLCLALAVAELVIVSQSYPPGATPLALYCHLQRSTLLTWEEPTPSAILEKEEPESKYRSIQQKCINSPCWLYC